MIEFEEELILALKDYFCGTITQMREGIQVKLSSGKTFFITVKET